MSSHGNQLLEETGLSLVARCIEGDQQAYSRFFYAYKELVYRVVYKFLGASDDTDDVVQQTFVEVFRSLRSFEGKSKFTTWLYRITLNVAAQHLRRRRGWFRGTSGDMRTDPELLADPSTADRYGVFERRQTQKEILDALKTLNPKKRTVVVLHDMEGMTMEEIAEIAGAPIGTIKSRLFHGREELKRKLARLLQQA